MKIIKTRFTVFLLGFTLTFIKALNAQTLVSQFDFNGNLNDNLAASTCSLNNNSATSYSSGVLSFTAAGSPGGGLIIDVPSSVFTFTNYSIAVEFSLGTLTGSYKKVIDFKNKNDDNGLYINGSPAVLEFYPMGTGSYSLAPNTMYTVLLTRNGATQICQTSILVGGVLQSQVTFTDVTSMATFTAVGSNRRIGLFYDDIMGVPGEYSPTGSVSSVKIWNGVVNTLTVCSSPTVNISGLSSICTGGSTTLTAGSTVLSSPAIGGVVTYSAGYTIHTFTTNGTFNVPDSRPVE